MHYIVYVIIYVQNTAQNVSACKIYLHVTCICVEMEKFLHNYYALSFIDQQLIGKFQILNPVWIR